MRRVIFLIVCLTGYFLALCVANRPRFWWQETLCSNALYWLPFALVALVFLSGDLIRKRTTRPWMLWSAVVCYGYASVFMLCKLFPFVHYNRWPLVIEDSESNVRGLWVDGWSAADRVAELNEVISVKQLSVVMIAGTAPHEALRDPLLDLFPYRATTAPVEPANGEHVSIAIFSKVPFTSERIDQFGVEALPGGVFPLQLPNGAVLELGVMSLVPSDSQQSFERNRITSRRLSALMRSSSAARIVAAQFSTTPFSQFMAVYPEQVKMRSLMYGIGLYKTFDMNNFSNYSTESNVFVSHNVARIEFERIRVEGRSRAMLYFHVQVARDLRES